MIKINNVSKSYKEANETVYAIKGVSLEIYDNELTFILGSSGSGKSTLLSLIGGIDKLDSGSIYYNDERIDSDGRKTKDYISFVFQEYNLIDSETVEYNLKIGNSSGDILKALDRVNLAGYANKLVKDLSGGEKTSVQIARAIIREPKILLCDEPTGSLDDENTKLIFSLLKELSKEMLVIAVSHDRDSASNYGDRIIELEDGVVIADEEKKSIPLMSLIILKR